MTTNACEPRAAATSEPGAEENGHAASLRREWDAYDAYLFDIDGTLMHCRDAVHYFAFCAALQMLAGRPLDLAGVTAHGNTDMGILRDALALAGVPEDAWRPKTAKAQSLMHQFVRDRRNEIRGEVLPGVRGVLSRLRRRGTLLGIVTGNVEQIARIKLECSGLSRYFQFGAYSDRCEYRQDVYREAIARVESLAGPEAAICAIGDTPTDVQAARATGIDVIAVATGVHSKEELLAERPHLCLPSLLQLLA